ADGHCSGDDGRRVLDPGAVLPCQGRVPGRGSARGQTRRRALHRRYGSAGRRLSRLSSRKTSLLFPRSAWELFFDGLRRARFAGHSERSWNAATTRRRVPARRDPHAERANEEATMIVSWNWLKEYVRLDMPVDALTERLMMAGLNLEEVSDVEGDMAIDLEVTSNRPDCLSHIGVAREVGVLFNRGVQLPP